MSNNQKKTHLLLAAISGLLALIWAFIYSQNQSTLALIWVIVDIITMVLNYVCAHDENE